MPKRLPSILKAARRPAPAPAEARGVTGESLWWPEPLRPGTRPVTPDAALSFTAYYAAVNVLATDTAALPLAVYRRTGDDSREPAREHPAHGLVAQSPDGETTSIRWRQALMGHVLGWGNGYAEVVRRGDGRPASLHLLDPATTRPARVGRELRYEVEGRGTLPAANVVHVAGFGFDGLSGYSAAALMRQAIELGLAAEDFGAAFFSQGARPSGVLEWPHKFKSREDKERFYNDWQSRYAGAGNAGSTVLLEPGMKYVPITISPEDAQFLATRQFQVLEVARWFRLPPHKVGDYSQSHLSNIEASNLDYLQTSLLPWLEAIEQELNRKLFMPGERSRYYVEHNMAGLLRGDSRARGEFYRQMRDLGVFSPNDIARRENLNPIGPEGDVRLVPGAMVPLSRAGEQMGAPVDPQPEPTEPEPPADA